MADSSMDFKYLIQDFSSYYVGCRLTYEEIIDQADMPGRLRSAVFRYIEDEVGLETRLCDHLVSLDKKSRSARVYDSIKAQITLLPNEGAGRKKQMTIEAADFFANDELRRSISPEELSEFKFKKKNLLFLRV